MANNKLDELDRAIEEVDNSTSKMKKISSSLRKLVNQGNQLQPTIQKVSSESRQVRDNRLTQEEKQEDKFNNTAYSNISHPEYSKPESSMFLGKKTISENVMKQAPNNRESPYMRPNRTVQNERNPVQTLEENKAVYSDHELQSDNVDEDLHMPGEDSEGVCIVLLGRAGTGKSATGNSILLREAFQVNEGTAQTDSNISVNYTQIQGQEVCVIDGPSMDDTSKFDCTFIDRFHKMIEVTVSKHTHVFIAFVIVLKYSNRFTSVDSATLETVKAIIGSNNLSDCGICLFTHEDVFKVNENEDFQMWCKKQTEDLPGLKDLLKECNNRCIIFNNRREDTYGNNRDQQRNDLMNLIKYENNHLEKCNVNKLMEKLKMHLNLSVESFFPYHKAKTEQFVRNVKSKIPGASKEFMEKLSSAVGKKIKENEQLEYDGEKISELNKPLKEVEVRLVIKEAFQTETENVEGLRGKRSSNSSMVF